MDWWNEDRGYRDFFLQRRFLTKGEGKKGRWLESVADSRVRRLFFSNLNNLISFCVVMMGLFCETVLMSSKATDRVCLSIAMVVLALQDRAKVLLGSETGRQGGCVHMLLQQICEQKTGKVQQYRIARCRGLLNGS